MRCLVTGASGHLGSFLARLLLAEGHTVAVLVRPQSDLWRISDILPQLHLLRADLADISGVESDLKNLSSEMVFHLAWQGVQSELRDDLVQLQSNLLGSYRLLHAVIDSGCKVLIGLGSQSEYGITNGLTREDSPTRPESLYGISKLCLGLFGQRLCFTAGVRFIWFRLFASYGPKDNEQHLIPSVILKLLAGVPPALTGGEQRWDYVFVQDAVQAIYHGAASEARGTFNLGSGRAQSVRSIVESIRDLINPNLSLGFGKLAYPPDQPMHLQADIRRLHQATGWLPTTSLDDGLAQTVSWYRQRAPAKTAELPF